MIRVEKGPDDQEFSLTLQKSRMLQICGVKGEAVVTYREPLTSLRQGFGPAGNKGDAVSLTFPTCPAEASAKAGG
jgi:hypothetical protein